MKDPLDRTKVVLRHLPPSISQSALIEQVDCRFAGRYKWVCFRPGKNSQKNHRYSRAYIDFKRSEDVVEFAEFFDGHIFVNEKGAQFKTIVEYAPSQHVPKPWSKKDGREGTILKDPEYLEFVEFLAKPTENLPSAEIQLERREAERAGAAKDTLIVTPLMDFVRQKRAAKSGSQRSSTNGKLSRRTAAVSAGNSGSISHKRGSEKRRVPTSMYVLRDGTKTSSAKDKSTFILVPRREEPQLLDKSIAIMTSSGAETLENETVIGTDGTASVVSGMVETGRRRLLVLKGKEVSHTSNILRLALEIYFHLSLELVLSVQASGGISQQQMITSPLRNSLASMTSRQNQRREVSGRLIKSILSNKEARAIQAATTVVPSEQQTPSINLEKDKRPPRPTNTRLAIKDHMSTLASISDSDTKRVVDEKVVGNDLHSSIPISERQDKRTRNKDRPDRGVWTPFRRSDGSHVDESVSSPCLPTQYPSDSIESKPVSRQVVQGFARKFGDDLSEDIDTLNLTNNSSSMTGKSPNLDVGGQYSRSGRSSTLSSHELPFSQEVKVDLSSTSRSGDIKNIGSVRKIVLSAENGSHRHVGRRAVTQGAKDVDGFPNQLEGKPSKRGGGGPGYGAHEKQIWVQKSASGS